MHKLYVSFFHSLAKLSVEYKTKGELVWDKVRYMYMYVFVLSVCMCI